VITPNGPGLAGSVAGQGPTLQPVPVSPVELVVTAVSVLAPPAPVLAVPEVPPPVPVDVFTAPSVPDEVLLPLVVSAVPVALETELVELFAELAMVFEALDDAEVELATLESLFASLPHAASVSTIPSSSTHRAREIAVLIA